MVENQKVVRLSCSLSCSLGPGLDSRVSLCSSLCSGLILLALLCVGTVHADDTPQPPLQTVQLQINDVVLTAEVAASAQQRYMGLSFRPELEKDAGMLFVYPEEQPLRFTMRNTLIPLSIAFISKDLVINEIHEMNVGPGQIFSSRKVAQFALEVDQGWFAANNIKAGDQIVRR